PDMKDIYDGIALLDSNGDAWINLPDWFEALNEDFRYQLTAIGAPASGLYVAQEMSGNKFKISGGKPGLKVSWQVTGIRHDALAKTHRFPVEQVKPPNLQGSICTRMPLVIKTTLKWQQKKTCHPPTRARSRS